MVGELSSGPNRKGGTFVGELTQRWPTVIAWTVLAAILNVALFYYVTQKSDRYLDEGGYFLGLLGLNLSLAGFGVTFWQLARTATAAEAATRAVEKLRDRLSRHDAAKEIAQATYALSIARSHVSSGGWQEVSRRCEDANQAFTINIDRGETEENEPIVIINVNTSENRLVDTFNDSNLSGITPKTPEYLSYWQVMDEIHRLGYRQAVGADDALDQIINELDDDVPF